MELEAYLTLVRRRREGAWQEQQRHPSEFVRALRERLERQRAQLEGEPLLVSMVKCVDPSDDSFAETVNVLLPAREL